MKFFSNQEIEDYYHQTQGHYDLFWKSKSAFGLHYGIWDEGVSSFKKAVFRTNELLSQLGDVQKGCNILDAGCGIGGSSFYLAQKYDAKVTGITLSEKQVNKAKVLSKKMNLNNNTNFIKRDYHQTSFEDNSFDYCWAMESMQTSNRKEKFIGEMARILKPGAKLLISDMFKPYNYNIDDYPDMYTYLNGWAMTDLTTVDEIINYADSNGFILKAKVDKTQEVAKTAKRMYYAGIIGAVGTKLYGLFNKATPFSKEHYKTGIAQYKGYKKGLWTYQMIVLQKK